MADDEHLNMDTAFGVLSKAVSRVEEIEKIVVFYMNPDGIIKFIGNCTVAEAIYLAECGKQAIFEAMKETPKS